jgi:glucose-6-phosphate isomerase
MNTIDFSKCRNTEEFASKIKETFPEYTKKERKRFAYEIMNNTKKRVFTYEEFNLIVKDSQERKQLESKHSGID